MLLSRAPRPAMARGARLAWLSPTPIAVGSGRINRIRETAAKPTAGSSLYWRGSANPTSDPNIRGLQAPVCLDPHHYPTAGGRTLILGAEAPHSPFDTATVGIRNSDYTLYIVYVTSAAALLQFRLLFASINREGRCRVRFVIPLLFRQHLTMRLRRSPGLSSRLALFRAGVATFQRFHRRPQGFMPIIAM